jgi:DNA-directed RNA polymerase III subunit RPC3
MPSQYAKKLACEIVVDQFGELVGKVCRTLVFKGQHALPDLGRDTELPPPQLRNCLLVLSQHNCVQAYRVEPDAVSPAVYEDWPH